MWLIDWPTSDCVQGQQLKANLRQRTRSLYWKPAGNHLVWTLWTTSASIRRPPITCLPPLHLVQPTQGGSFFERILKAYRRWQYCNLYTSSMLIKTVLFKMPRLAAEQNPPEALRVYPCDPENKSPIIPVGCRKQRSGMCT